MLDNAYVLIGLSVLMHVAWNLLARHVNTLSNNKANYLWWGLLAHLVLLGPYAIWHLIISAQWTTTLVVALLITASANTLYFIALRRAYHFAPVALVYPLARSSPILIGLWAWLFFEESLSLLETLSIAISVAGLWVLAASSKNGDSRHALPWAVTAAVATSIYSLSDKAAVVYLPGFAAQLGFITIGYAAAFIGLSIVQYKETKNWIPAARPALIYILVGGLFIGTAYALVVRAMRELPASHVVSFTNAGIVLAVLLSITLYRERVHWQKRLIGSLIVTVGLGLLAWMKI